MSTLPIKKGNCVYVVGRTDIKLYRFGCTNDITSMKFIKLELIGVVYTEHYLIVEKILKSIFESISDNNCIIESQNGHDIVKEAKYISDFINERHDLQIIQRDSWAHKNNINFICNNCKNVNKRDKMDTLKICIKCADTNIDTIF
jgi:hypothetical protein